jgi:RimJ/RimL family protein N-acetyltransferase
MATPLTSRGFFLAVSRGLQATTACHSRKRSVVAAHRVIHVRFLPLASVGQWIETRTLAWASVPEGPLSFRAIMRGVQRHSVGDSAHHATALRTARLILTPLSPLDEAEHARASGNSDDALRDTRAAELQWREHGFGPWAIRDLGDNSFLGAAELRFAGDGIEGIAPYEVEAGWWVRENRRNQRIATEAMRVAIGDLWSRAGVESVTAYIEAGENGPSRRLAASLGFTMRSQGRGRFGEPMTVYELLRDVWDRRGD